jgi:hypothetical protein
LRWDFLSLVFLRLPALVKMTGSLLLTAARENQKTVNKDLKNGQLHPKAEARRLRLLVVITAHGQLNVETIDPIGRLV